ncbi:PAS domain S-box protein [Luteibacter sp.]|uniref:PAS domain-containing hybrid sensor histidine kinase/response regulator n=1 Tax=Luteibacter sp. TaxID=1886636 RepID=UPI002809EC53|nr:PAS domain S-box protein [Luteibacter sp.]MDQ8051191.1 PAS domain S-box protein [Luteibacter sp.]
MSTPGDTPRQHGGWHDDLEDAVYRRLVESVRDYAIFLLDHQGYIRSWNQGAERIKGYRAQEIIGKHFSVFYPQERIDQGWPQHELEVAQALGRFEDEGWRLRKDGSRFWANIVFTRIDHPDGTLRGFAKITRDLTERRAHEQDLARSEERFRLMVDNVRDYAIFMLDTQGCVASWNKGAQQIKGYSHDEIVGRHFSTFYPQDVIASGWPDRELQIALAEGRMEDEGWRVRKDGTRFWASVVITALFDDEGRHIGFAKVVRDLTDRRRIRTLEDEGQRLTTFLAMLAHELRNPLAPIANSVAIMQSQPIEAESLRFCRDVIGRQAAQLTRLVDDLLDVSRITSGKIKLERAVVDLRAALTQAMETIAPEAQRVGHTLDLELPDEPVWVSGDLARMLQVFGNLLSNAVKFTPAGGTITASMAVNGTRAEVRVRDTGPGIPPARLADVFGLFVQGEPHSPQAQVGLGLGLSLVQQLVSLHDGEVSAFSTGEPGKGAEFLVVLPIVAGPADLASSSQSAPPARARHLLVVDDNRDAADTLQQRLQASGYRTATAYDGRSAMAAIGSTRFDAVLLDLGLPDISGLEVARQLGQTLDDPPPFIAVTGYGQESDLAATKAAGFRSHLTKPLRPDEVERALSQLFDHAG